VRLCILACALFVLIAASAFAGAQKAPDAAGILILGDSNSEGPFGGTLYDSLRAMRDPVTGELVSVKMFAKCGAGANDWVEKGANNIDCGAWVCDAGRSISSCPHFMGGYIPPLSELYGDLQAQRRVTILALGLNMIIGRRAQKLQDARSLIDAIHAHHSACIWVGPPQPGDLFIAPAVYDSFVADLKSTVTTKGCRYIGSDDKTDRNVLGQHTKEDHYPKEEAVIWAEKVLDDLNHPPDRDEKPLRELLKSDGLTTNRQP
jgi:hypothetical protein